MDFELTQHIKQIEYYALNYGNIDTPDTETYLTELQDIKNYKNSTTRRRAEFELLNLAKVNYIKSTLLIVYGLLVLWFAYTLFKNKDMKLQQKGILLGLMLVYPYIAPPLLIYLYETMMYMVALMTGEIYKKAELQ
jgi:hypothetical protein